MVGKHWRMVDELLSRIISHLKQKNILRPFRTIFFKIMLLILTILFIWSGTVGFATVFKSAVVKPRGKRTKLNVSILI